YQLGAVLLTLNVEEDITDPSVHVPGNSGWAGTKGRGLPFVLFHENMHVEQVRNALDKQLAKIKIPVTTAPGQVHDEAHARQFFRNNVRGIFPVLIRAAMSSIKDDNDFLKQVDSRWFDENNHDYGGSSFS